VEFIKDIGSDKPAYRYLDNKKYLLVNLKSAVYQSNKISKGNDNNSLNFYLLNSGIKIQSIPESFNFQQKYILQNINGVKYIKLRLKDAESWGNILTEILETKITIINDYETDNKPIREMFIKFKNCYKIPENFLITIKECPGLRYYYSSEEREKYLNNWNNKKAISVIPFNKDEYIFYERITTENQYVFEVQRTHYLDEGCNCKACQLKRDIIIDKAERGEKVNQKIIHNESAVEYLKKQAQSKVKLIIGTRIKNQNENQKKLSSIFGNSINRPASS
jgi:hypothetical protein